MSIVANCHKVPQKKLKAFIIDRCDSKSIHKNNLFIQSNPKSGPYFTVSPVRHIKMVLLKINGARPFNIVIK
jgi:hypothetical protein